MMSWRSWNNRDEDDMLVSLGVQEGVMVKFSLVTFSLFSFPFSSSFKLISAKNKLNNHIVEIVKTKLHDLFGAS